MALVNDKLDVAVLFLDILNDNSKKDIKNELVFIGTKTSFNKKIQKFFFFTRQVII